MSSTAQVTEDELTERARAGDAAAFGALVDRHRAAVIRAALAALGNREDAEDVAQEAFVRCHRALHTFRGASSLRTWLVAAAWRLALTRRRSLGRWVKRGVIGWAGTDGDGIEEPADPGPSPEQVASAREIRRRLAGLVRSLPARLRDPLLLSASGEYTTREIAELLGAPEGTVKWRVSEARRVLREKLERVGRSRTT